MCNFLLDLFALKHSAFAAQVHFLLIVAYAFAHLSLLVDGFVLLLNFTPPVIVDQTRVLIFLAESLGIGFFCYCKPCCSFNGPDFKENAGSEDNIIQNDFAFKLTFAMEAVGVESKHVRVLVDFWLEVKPATLVDAWQFDYFDFVVLEGLLMAGQDCCHLATVLFPTRRGELAPCLQRV